MTAVSEATRSNATKQKQDESTSTSGGKKNKNSNSTNTAAAAGRVSPIEGDLLNASNFFEEAQKRYYGYAALETAMKNQEAKNKELVNKVHRLEEQMKEKKDTMKHLEDRVEALKGGKIAVDNEVRQLKSHVERLRRRSSSPSNDEDILRGLDKELIEIIKNQIVDDGDLPFTKAL